MAGWKRAFDPEDSSAAFKNGLEGGAFIRLEMEGLAESGTEGGAQESFPGGSPDEQEGGKVKLEKASVDSLVEGELQAKIVHGSVEIFLDGSRHPVNFIDEEQASHFQAAEDPHEVLGPFKGWTAGHPHGALEFGCEDMSETCFPEAGRADEEKMFQDLLSGLGSLDHDLQGFEEAFLPQEIREILGAKSPFRHLFVAPGGEPLEGRIAFHRRSFCRTHAPFSMMVKGFCFPSQVRP